MTDTLATIHALRSTHGDFDLARPLAPDTLDAILAASVRAANASGRQSYAIVVVDDPATMGEFQYPASAMLVYCVDYTRLLDTARLLGHPEVAFRGMVPFITAAVDTALAAQTAAIAARALGVDSLFTNSVHRLALPRVYELLGLPEEGCFPLIALALGYAKSEPAALKGRLLEPGVVHRGRYQRLSEADLQAVIAQYDDPATHMGLGDWANEGFAHYLDWFFTKWHRNVPEAKDAEVRAALARARFLACSM